MKITKLNLYSKFKKKDGHLHGDNHVKKALPNHLGALIFSNSKRIMKKCMREINGFYNIRIYYGDTESLYLEKNYWDVLDEAILVGKDLCQGKNDNET